MLKWVIHVVTTFGFKRLILGESRLYGFLHRIPMGLNSSICGDGVTNLLQQAWEQGSNIPL